MGIVVRKPGRGRVVLQKRVNQNPRKGLTLRMMLEANKKARIPTVNMPTLRILEMVRGQVRNVQRRTKHDGYLFKVRDSVRTTPRDPIKKHVVNVMFQDPIEKTAGIRMSNRNINLFVSCSCEFFMFVCEYALTHYGASYIKYSNGDPPLTTNPSLFPLGCKHVHLCLLTIQRKGL